MAYVIYKTVKIYYDKSDKTVKNQRHGRFFDFINYFLFNKLRNALNKYENTEFKVIKVEIID